MKYQRPLSCAKHNRISLSGKKCSECVEEPKLAKRISKIARDTKDILLHIQWIDMELRNKERNVENVLNIVDLEVRREKLLNALDILFKQQ